LTFQIVRGDTPIQFRLSHKNCKRIGIYANHIPSRFVVSRVLKPEKERAQLSLLEGDEYKYFFFVTNTELPSEKVIISYEKRGNSENSI